MTFFLSAASPQSFRPASEMLPLSPGEQIFPSPALIVPSDLPLSAISKHIREMPKDDPLAIRLRSACFKEEGVFAQLSNWWHGRERPKTALGKVLLDGNQVPKTVAKAQRQADFLVEPYRTPEWTSCAAAIVTGGATSVATDSAWPFLVGVSGCLPGAFGQQKVGQEFQVNTFTTSTQDAPSVASLNNGDFVVTWESLGQDGDIYGVYGQLFDNAGVKIGSEFQVNTYTTSYQRYPLVTSLSNGNFIITWYSLGQDGDSDGVYGQIFNNVGVKTGGEFQVNTHTTLSQGAPSVVGLNNGNFIITWHSQGQDGGSYGVYGQLFDSTGVKIGGEFQVNTYTASIQWKPLVTNLNNGNFVIIWSSLGQDGDGYGVYGQIFDSLGTKTGSEFQVNNYTTSNQQNPSLASCSNSNFVVTWESSGQDGDLNGVYGQIFDSVGVKIGDEFQVNTYTISGQRRPSVASFSNCGFFVTWESYFQDGDSGGIYGQLFNKIGANIGSEFQINNYTTLEQFEPSGASFSNGNFVVVWTSDSQDGDGYGIYGQIFNNMTQPLSTGTTETTATTGITRTTATTGAIQTTGTTRFVVGSTGSTTGTRTVSTSSSPTQPNLVWLWVVLGIVGGGTCVGVGAFLALRNRRTPVEIDFNGSRSSSSEELVFAGDADEVGPYHNTREATIGQERTGT